MRIAVLGAGFCGMAVAWNLLQFQDMEVVIFDPKGLAKGTSSVAAGLLHPYVGAHSKLNWRAAEGMLATNKLLKVAEQALSSPVAYPQGMLRLCTSAQQTKDFAACAHLYSDVHWRTTEECLSTVPQILPYAGIFIDSAATVDCASYLKGLWLACKERGANFEQAAIDSLQQLDKYDRIFVTMGAHTTNLPELAHLPIRPTKGQVLEYAWPQDLPRLPYPVNSQAYLLMHPQKPTCILGASYEKQFSDDAPDIEIAKNEILPKARVFFPQINDMQLLDCRAGVRAGTPNRQPLIAQINEKCWALTGMGSKGLLYHALFAEEIVFKSLGHPFNSAVDVA